MSDMARIRGALEAEAAARDVFHKRRENTHDAVAGAVLDRDAKPVRIASEVGIPLARVEHIVATEEALRKQKASRIA